MVDAIPEATLFVSVRQHGLKDEPHVRVVVRQRDIDSR
jgi:hypothetical protein